MTLSPWANGPTSVSINSPMTLLARWFEGGGLRAIDYELPRALAAMSEESLGVTVSEEVLFLVGLLSYLVGRGHVCIDLKLLLENPEGLLDLDDTWSSPEAARDVYPALQATLSAKSMSEWLACLSGSPLVGEPDSGAPVILWAGKLYLRRLWVDEQIIAEGITRRLAPFGSLRDPDGPEAQQLAAILDELFPEQTEAIDYQRAACALMARAPFGVMTGGPGTGKTRTVLQLLMVLQALQQTHPEARPLVIRLAAPTGKAAARLTESIQRTRAALLQATPTLASYCEQIPAVVTTVHRLLGRGSSRGRFLYTAQHPLPVDVLVIDEASMVDVELMSAVLAALPEGARLILIGDKDQLASVDAGAVLGELCERADRGDYTPETQAWLEHVCGKAIPEQLTSTTGSALDQCVAMLRKSHRFADDSSIGRLARMINSGTVDDALFQALQTGQLPGCAWLSFDPIEPSAVALPSNWSEHLVSGSPDCFTALSAAPPVGFQAYLQQCRQHPGVESTPEDWDDYAKAVLTQFNRFQILTPLRRGPTGVETLNQLITNALRARKLIESDDEWYLGRPVLVTENDYQLGLMNGDVGVVLVYPREDREWGVRVAFESGDTSTGIRWVAPSRLKRVETVFAMTVHKSQGSEFEHCCLILPTQLSPLLTKELLYTAVTRSQRFFSVICGDDRIFRSAISQRVVRASGLREQINKRVASH